MVDHPDQAAPHDAPPVPSGGGSGLAALLDSGLDGLFEPPPVGVGDPEWSVHLPFLAWLVTATRPSVLVTLGAAAAHIGCCAAVSRFALPTRCCAVLDGDAVALPPALLHLQDSRYTAFSRLVTSSPHEEASCFADGSVDLLIIGLDDASGWAGAAGTERLDRWTPKFSPRAVLVVHGTASLPPTDAAIWHSVRRTRPVFELHQGAGLGVAAVGAAVPPALDHLFVQENRSGDLSRLRDRLALLGERWRAECLIEAGREAAQHREAVDRALLQERNESLRDLTAARNRLRDELAAAKDDRHRLERQAAALEARLQDQDEHHRTERRRGDERARDQTAATARLSDRIEALRDVLDRTIERAAAERAASATALADAAATADLLRAALADRDNTVRALHRSLSWRLTRPLRELRAALHRGAMLEPIQAALPASPAEAVPQKPFPLPDDAMEADLPPPPDPAVPDDLAAAAPDGVVPAPAPIGAGGWRPIRRILFVAGEPGTPGAVYRTARNAAACRAAGFEADCVDIAGVDPDNLAAADLVVLWRAGFSAHVQTMLALAAHARTRVVFDVDDLIVQPALAVAEIIDGIRTTFVTEAESRAYFQSMQRTMLNCDLCTATTLELAAAMGQQHPMVHILPNTFDDAVERASRRAVRLRGEQAQDELVRLGYAGGTRTHQKDFATIVPSLVAILSQRAHARLVLFRDGRSGEGLVLLDEFPELLPFAEQIEWRDLVPLADLPFELARFDISLCPLEQDNPFCDAKSELKYFESALAGVCVVATPTGPFRRAVQDGITGFLPQDGSRWTETLLRLVDDPALRRRIARRASHDVLWRFGPRRQAELWALLLRELDGGVRGARAAELRLRRGDYAAAELPDVPDGELLFSHDRLGEAVVTIGMTSFNYENHLEEALASVVRQTLQHIDLVVVDDGSSDNSVPLLLDWAERNRARFNRLRILRTVSNAGLGGARNLMFAEAETPWIMVLDSDNRLAPTACEILLDAVRADGLAAFAYPRIRQFGGADLLTGTEDFQPSRLAAGNYIDAMALVAKWAWAAAGGYYVRRDAMGWEDFSLWCRLVELGLHGVPVAEELGFYRVHARSMVNAITEQSDNKRAMVAFVEARHPWLRLRMRAARKRLDRPSPR